MLREKLGELSGRHAVCKDRLSAGTAPRIMGITSHAASAGGSILYCNGYFQHVSPLIAYALRNELEEILSHDLEVEGMQNLIQ